MPIPGGIGVLIGSMIILLPLFSFAIIYLYKWMREGYEEEIDETEPAS